ncbi:hypothetical protein BB561_004069 [Smittium simulii]|uniref:Methyltransferase type 11 domain-containing protein n=1 Tax=Smittium simulii TaxID=133385 RepID=A0A2T9YI51_9FUNG|nr:hypothetical protein BB561_004069 [Smittium simulii]
MSTYSNDSYNYSGYATSRPTYNPDLIKFLLDYHLSCPGNKTHTALDAATGTGIFARLLCKSFTKTIATDISEKMLAVAAQTTDDTLPIEYLQLSSEDLSSIPDHSIDLLTVATGAHWFKSEAFMKEAKRVLVPNGTLAIFGYSGFGEFVALPECSRIFREYGMDIIGPYWDTGRDILTRLYSHYSHLATNMGFKDVALNIYPKSSEPYVGTHYSVLDAPTIINHKFTWGSFYNFIKTWSAATNYNLAHPNQTDINLLTIERLMKAAGTADFDQNLEFNMEQSILICRA